MLFLDFGDALPFLAAGILILTASAAFQGTALWGRPLFMPFVSAALFSAVGGIYVIQSLAPMEHLAPYIAAAALTGTSARFFQSLLHPAGDRPAPERRRDSRRSAGGTVQEDMVQMERFRQQLREQKEGR